MAPTSKSSLLYGETMTDKAKMISFLDQNLRSNRYRFYRSGHRITYRCWHRYCDKQNESRERKKITKQTPREDFHKLNELSFWPPLPRKAPKASPLRNTNNSQFIKLIFRQLENAFVSISISRNWQLSGPARNLRWKNGISFASSGWFDIYGGGGKAFIVMCPCQSWWCCWLFRFIRGVKQCVSIDCYHFFFVFTDGY